MFGPFRFTNPLRSGLLWKIPWRLSKFQKRRQRHRLRAVDSVVATIENALAKKGETVKAVERWRAEMPKEEEMLAKDKYTIFDRKEKRYRKGIHSMFARALIRPGGREVCLLGLWAGLTLDSSCRAAKVDEGISAAKPTRILDAASATTCTVQLGDHDVLRHYVHYLSNTLNLPHTLGEWRSAYEASWRLTCQIKRGRYGVLGKPSLGMGSEASWAYIPADQPKLRAWNYGLTSDVYYGPRWTQYSSLTNVSIEINAEPPRSPIAILKTEQCALSLLYPLPRGIGGIPANAA